MDVHISNGAAAQHHDPAEHSARGWFRTTQWTDILHAKHGSGTAGAEAAEAKIFESYWRPIYAYLRRSGNSRADAEDLTQGFFEHLLAKDWLRTVEPGRGKFRTFLLRVLKNFCINVQAKARAQKRGGNLMILSMDEIRREEEHLFRQSQWLSPEENFDRRWAESLMERAINRLQREYVANGREDLFRELRNTDPRDQTDSTYAEIGKRIGLSGGAVKTAAHRMHRRLAAILRLEVGATVDSPDEVKEEMRYLRQALSGPGAL